MYLLELISPAKSREYMHGCKDRGNLLKNKMCANKVKHYSNNIFYQQLADTSKRVSYISRY